MTRSDGRMPGGLRGLALLHSALLLLIAALAAATSSLPVFALVAIVFLTPLGPLLFIDRPLMWHFAKASAYLFAFVTGLWVTYSVLDLDSLPAALRALALALLAVYLIGVGGFLKSAAVRGWFAERTGTGTGTAPG